MFRCTSLIVLALCFLSSTSGFVFQQFVKETLLPNENADLGEPLLVTPYIEIGDIETAQNLSLVQLEGTSMKTYSGFFTVNKRYKSNMFFWFCPSQNKDPRDPVVVWLQGGPGSSSLYGLFVENGPFVIDKDLKLHERKFSWNKNYNVLFFDNPVGTGFSFSDDEGYAKNEDDVADNLYKALLQFFEMFPDLKGNDVYLSGESYAGKYIPALAHKIHVQPQPKKVNMKGVAIGNGFTDPPVMIHAYADFMFETGLVDENQRDEIKGHAAKFAEKIKEKQWSSAFYVVTKLLQIFEYASGSGNIYNYLMTEEPEDFTYFSKYINQDEIRKRIHVGSRPFHDGEKVYSELLNDFAQSAKHLLVPIMDEYKVLIYNGNLDIIVALPLTEAMLQELEWKDADKYKEARRTIWRVHPDDKEVAGYVKRVNNFYQVSIRGAGHMAPYDQPERSWDMLKRFIEDEL